MIKLDAMQRVILLASQEKIYARGDLGDLIDRHRY
jgi:hypothetical protein